jgi:hypothetical protein
MNQMRLNWLVRAMAIDANAPPMCTLHDVNARSAPGQLHWNTNFFQILRGLRSVYRSDAIIVGTQCDPQSAISPVNSPQTCDPVRQRRIVRRDWICLESLFRVRGSSVVGMYTAQVPIWNLARPRIQRSKVELAPDCANVSQALFEKLGGAPNGFEKVGEDQRAAIAGPALMEM